MAADIEAYRFREAQKAMLSIADFGNGFLQFNEPWKQIKTDPDRVASILTTALQIVATLSVAAEPFLPFSAARIRTMLGLPALERGDWEIVRSALSNGELLLADGRALGEPGLLFEKIDDEVVEAETARLAATRAVEGGTPTDAEAVGANGEPNAPLKEPIAYEDFAKLDIRTGTVLTAEKMPKADKLLKLEVDLGFERRTIVSGIAKHFSPDDLPGRRVVVLANLTPRKLRGVESNGMILMAEDAGGTLSFVAPRDEEGPDGSPVA